MATPRKLRCRVEAVTDHGEHVYTVDLAPEAPAPRFLPGQFLHLALEPEDRAGFWPESRVFSIASPPRRRDRLRICYSVKGSFTRAMEAALRPGGDVWVKLPYGDFTIDARTEVVLLGGGTGISAFSAFLEELPAEHDQPVQVLYGARTPDLLIYRAELERLAARVPAVAVTLAAESGAPAASGAPRVACAHARLHPDLAWPRLRAPGAAVFYLSGPPAMLKGLSALLRERGVDAGRIRIDAWE